MTDFLGTATPLTTEGIGGATTRMGVTAPQLWAVLEVETKGCGFLPDRRPEILFEHRVFQRLTGGRFDEEAPALSNANQHAYGAPGANQYLRLQSAIRLDREAALRSASWGIGQVMGFNAVAVGFSSTQDMVTAMMASEDNQLESVVAFVIANRLQHSLAANDFRTFARGFNGPNFSTNSYDVRLASAHAKFASGGLPDLIVRTAQVFLRYLGHDPGPIDGFVGKRTRSALAESGALGPEGILPNDNVTPEILARLQQDIDRQPPSA
jgi:hypothetical protein